MDIRPVVFVILNSYNFIQNNKMKVESWATWWSFVLIFSSYFEDKWNSEFPISVQHHNSGAVPSVTCHVTSRWLFSQLTLNDKMVFWSILFFKILAVTSPVRLVCPMCHHMKQRITFFMVAIVALLLYSALKLLFEIFYHRQLQNYTKSSKCFVDFLYLTCE